MKTNFLKAGVAILILDKKRRGIRNATTDKGSYDIMIMDSILKENREILNMYAPTTGFHNT